MTRLAFVGSIVLVALSLGGCDGASGDDGGEGDVRIIRGAAEDTRWLDLTIEGENLDLAAGTVATIQIGRPDRPPERLGWARAVVEEGAFRVHFPDVWEEGLYKQTVVLFDRAGDGACSEDDVVVSDVRGALEDLTMRVSPPEADGVLFGDFYRDTCEAVIASWPSE